MLRYVGAVIIFFMLVLTACEGNFELPGSEEASDSETSEAQNESRSSLERLGDAVSGLRDQAERMQDGEEAIEPVNFRELRDLLPEALPGLERTGIQGEQQGMMGFSVSTAEATYEGEDGARLEMRIMDIGSVSSLALLGMGWAMADFDRETESGYERTVTYRGHKAREQYNRDREQGELQLFVSERFVVSAEGRGMPMESIQGGLDEIDLSVLERFSEEE